MALPIKEPYQDSTLIMHTWKNDNEFEFAEAEHRNGALVVGEHGHPCSDGPIKSWHGRARLDLTNRARTTAPLPVLCVDCSASRLLMTRISTPTSMFVFSQQQMTY
ncbi:hypothetical protein VPH35_116018 [Triticum aestivum]|uniref:Uncharacterized protein n=1 Tax=Aegilops tauschii TaxID=37682 RepID=R7W7Z5_AEGTA